MTWHMIHSNYVHLNVFTWLVKVGMFPGLSTVSSTLFHCPSILDYEAEQMIDYDLIYDPLYM